MKQALLTAYYFVFTCSPCFSQWQQTSGPPGGTVKAIIRNSQYIFVAMDGDGVYRTPLDTIAWEEVNSGLTNNSIKTFGAIGDRIFAGTSSGVFRTDDNGANWIDQTDQVHQSVLSFASDNNEIYAGCIPTIFYSADSGLTWSGLTYSGQYLQYDLLLRNDTIYTGCDDFLGQPYWGVRVSYDHGINWYPIIDGLNDYGVYSIAHIQNQFFAGTKSHGVYKSTFTNPDWTPANSGMENRLIYDMIEVDSLLIALTDEGLYSSGDFGASWNEWGSLIQYAHPISMFKSDSLIYLGTSGAGLLNTDKDGLQFSSLGLPKSLIGIIEANDTVSVCQGGLGEIYRTFNSGTTWENLGINYPGYITTIPGMLIHGNDLFIATTSGCLFSDDYGATWEKRNNGLDDDTFTYVISKGLDALYLSSFEHLYRSLDNGLSWTMLPEIGGIDWIAENNDYLFASPDGLMLYRTLNLGQYWEDISTSSPLHYLYLYSPVVCSSRVFILGEDLNTYVVRVFYSDDNGDTWFDIPSSTGLTTTSAAQIIVVEDSLIIPTSDGDIFVSSDLGNTWESINEGLPDDAIFDAAVNGNYLLAGTLGDGVWRRPLAEIFNHVNAYTGSRSEANVFPNPTDGELIVTITPSSDLVVLSIYDLYGRRLSSVVTRCVAQQKLQLNASDLFKGVPQRVYEIVITNGDETTSVTIVKN